MTRRAKPAKAPTQSPRVLVLGRVRARVPEVRRVLERYGMVTTTIGWRASASELWRLGADAPHAIVVDIPPPVTAQQVDVLQHLRDRWEHVPQVVVTGASDPSLLTSLLAVGVDDFVTRSNTWAELVVRVRRQLRRVTPLATPLTIGPDGLHLDDIRRTVSAHGRTVRLTSREFEVFRCLVEAGGATVPRSAILRAVWGNGKRRSPAAGIVGVYVLYVRRKLTKVGLAHALRTVKGEGYSFQAPGEYWAPVGELATAGLAARRRTGAVHRHLASSAG